MYIPESSNPLYTSDLATMPVSATYILLSICAVGIIGVCYLETLRTLKEIASYRSIEACALAISNSNTSTLAATRAALDTGYLTTVKSTGIASKVHDLTGAGEEKKDWKKTLRRRNKLFKKEEPEEPEEENEKNKRKKRKKNRSD
ncbi:hypothetical protein TWF281_005405 [Arthrobotrys megalospora]